MLRFRLRDILVIFLGIAIGYSLNITTARLLIGPANEARMSVFSAYVIEPPDVLSIEASGKFTDAFPPISGKYTVQMDGHINLGAFGTVYVAGLTVQQAQDAFENRLAERVASPKVILNVDGFNSKRYYIVTQSNGINSVVQQPITGNDTVLDAVAQIGGIPQNGRLWIARPAFNGRGNNTMILPVKWDEISAGKSTTNYQLMPRDRLFIDDQPARAAKIGFVP